jgi:hypothetical protein
MDAAEYVVSQDDRMALAALALDSLSDGVSDESILHLIATLDTQVDLQLLVRTGGGLLMLLTCGCCKAHDSLQADCVFTPGSCNVDLINQTCCFVMCWLLMA